MICVTCQPLQALRKNNSKTYITCKKPRHAMIVSKTRADVRWKETECYKRTDREREIHTDRQRHRRTDRDTERCRRSDGNAGLTNANGFLLNRSHVRYWVKNLKHVIRLRMFIDLVSSPFATGTYLSPLWRSLACASMTNGRSLAIGHDSVSGS